MGAKKMETFFNEINIKTSKISETSYDIVISNLHIGNGNTIVHTLRRTLNNYTPNIRIIAIETEGLQNEFINLPIFLESTLIFVKNTKEISFEMDLSKVYPEIFEGSLSKSGTVHAEDINFSSIKPVENNYLCSLSSKTNIKFYAAVGVGFQTKEYLKTKFDSKVSEKAIFLDTNFSPLSKLEFILDIDENEKEVLRMQINVLKGYDPLQIISNSLYFNQKIFENLYNKLNKTIQTDNLNNLLPTTSFEDVTNVKSLVGLGKITARLEKKMLKLDLLDIKDLQKVKRTFLFNNETVPFTDKEVFFLETMLKSKNLNFEQE